MKRKMVFVLLAVVLLLAACVPSQDQIDQILSSVEQTAIAQITVVAPTQNVDEIVQATFQALTAQAPAAGSTGSISGKLSYPSEGIPPLLVAAFNIQTGQTYTVSTVQNQATYQIDNLPAGSYHVFAYTLPDGGLVGAYDQFYLCGLQQGCTDFSLIDVQVTAGAVTQNVDPGDWYGDATQYPSFPIANAPQNDGTDVIPTFTPVGGLSGSIAGQLSYPAEGIPAMAVVAYVAGGSPLDYYYIVTNAGANTYQIDNLPPGNYQVVAYTLGGGGFPSGLAGGYSQAVPCGLSVDCADHSLIVVQVLGGQVTSAVNPQDWYAPDGTFPAYPLP